MASRHGWGSTICGFTEGSFGVGPRRVWLGVEEIGAHGGRDHAGRDEASGSGVGLDTTLCALGTHRSIRTSGEGASCGLQVVDRCARLRLRLVESLTEVEFRLEPEGSGTRLTVVETGFGELSVPADERAAYVDDNTTGWRDELDGLRAYLAA